MNQPLALLLLQLRLIKVAIRDSLFLIHPNGGSLGAAKPPQTPTIGEVWRVFGPSTPPQWDDYLDPHP
jgi:hypothetical protein